MDRKNRIILLAAGLSAALMLGGCTSRQELTLRLGAAGVDGVDGESYVNLGQDGAAGSDNGGADDDESYVNPSQDSAAESGDATGADGVGTESYANQNAASAQSATNPNTFAGVIYVHVCGAVQNPDVYELPEGSRVYEAVQAAGGFASDADESYVNQAQKLPDGAKLVIPTLEQTAALTEAASADTALADTASAAQQGEAGQDGGAGREYGIVRQDDGAGVSESAGQSASGGGTGGVSGASDGRVNINTATVEELCGIPGIGSTRAAAIVAYREKAGGFSSVEEIMNVSGIKEGTYEKIRDSIKVE